LKKGLGSCVVKSFSKEVSRVASLRQVTIDASRARQFYERRTERRSSMNFLIVQARKIVREVSDRTQKVVVKGWEGGRTSWEWIEQ
jgi:hypothetical protein